MNHVLERLGLHRLSIVTRLTLFFTLATAAILFTVSGLLYEELSRQLAAKDLAELTQGTTALSETVRELANERDSDDWRREWAENIARSRRLAARVLTPNGEVYVATPNLAIPAQAFPLEGGPLQYGRRHAGEDDYYLLMTLPVEVHPSRVWHIEAALDLTQSHGILRAYKDRLAQLLLAALGITALTGWLIARRSLLPLTQIGSAMHRISAEELSGRIGDRPWPNELVELANAFDAMLERIEAAFNQLHRFSADLAHEVRTPVNNLLAAASVTLARARAPAEYQDTLETVVVECESLARMVETMLFLARADNAAEILHPERMSAAEELQRQAEFFEAKAAEAQISMSCSGHALFSADPLLIRRALSNLIDNAIRHTPPGGQICLLASECDSVVTLTVRDDGSGIQAEHLPHLFDRFYRVESARDERGHTGLGLAIVHSIASLHGGSIRVSSQFGCGSTFTLTLPKMTIL
ncbi:MAG: heavy metal sensor histidine kinase [Rhodocyclaceae bacterium]|nr:heavy metal sensor histidine kinase [Rhodocyclaceae bacterium]